MRGAAIRSLGVAGALALALLLAPSPASAAKGPSCNIASPTGLRSIPLTDQGANRPFLLDVPDGYKRKRAVPLVISLHGSGGNGLAQLATGDFEANAGPRGYAVAAPNGAVQQGESSFSWNVPGVPLTSGQPIPAGTPNDETYLLRVIKAAKKAVCIDPRRVYFTGISGGARMGSQMACDHPTAMAAFAPVVGLRAGVPREDADGSWSPDPATCKPKKPVSVLAFHGTDDPINPFAGNDDPRWGYGVEEALGTWARIDRCKRGPGTKQVTETADLVAYGKCEDGSDVGLYRLAGAGHNWPGFEAVGVGPIDFSVDATDLILDFFAKHKLPKKAK